MSIARSTEAASRGNGAASHEYVTVRIGEQWCGIPVLSVQDVLGPQKLALIPLAPREVAGALNLRGRIVTAIDVRCRLGLQPADRNRSMSVVVEHHNEPYSLLIDEVGEVLSLPENSFERNPPTLDVCWREVSAGIHRLEGRLLVLLQVERLLDFRVAEAA